MLFRPLKLSLPPAIAKITDPGKQRIAAALYHSNAAIREENYPKAFQCIRKELRYTDFTPVLGQQILRIIDDCVATSAKYTSNY